MSASFTCTISLSFSTSTSSTSCSREGQAPSRMHCTQRMISTMPCNSSVKPASGMTNLNGYSGSGSAEKVCSRIASASLA